MSQIIHPFYPIVENFKWVERLVPLGVKTIQLRHKGEAAELQGDLLAAKALCEKHNCQLILNDHWQLALDLQCNFIHLGQEDLELADMKAIKKAGIKIGISTHSHDELETALSFNPDYIALGPIFGTVSKQLKWQAQGLDRIGEWKRQIGNIPLAAIGGITLESANSVFAAGANSIAVISDITNNKAPEVQAKKWLQIKTD